MAGTYLLAVRCPVQRGVNLVRAFVRNLRTWLAMERERHKWTNHEAESTDAPPRGGLLRISVETGNARGAKGAGHPRRDLPGQRGNRRNSPITMEGGSL